MPNQDLPEQLNAIRIHPNPISLSITALTLCTSYLSSANWRPRWPMRAAKVGSVVLPSRNTTLRTVSHKD